MAMTPRPRIGGAATPSHSRTAVQPVYESFRPVSEWQKDEESNVLLLIYLPGFLKQDLEVSTEGRNIVRVRGARLVAGNKWSRFQEGFKAPEDCNMRGIHAKFEEGILTITMPPKKESTKPVPKAPIIPSKHRLSQNDLASTTRTGPDIKKEPSSSTATSQSIPEEKGKLPEKSLESSPGRKMSSTQPQVTKNDVVEKQRETKTTVFTSANDVKQIRETELQHPKPQKPKKFKEESPEDRMISAKDDNGADDRVEDIGWEGKHIQPDEKQPRKDVASGIVDQSGTGNYKKSVKRPMETKEERQLLVNVGVAVLVIVAFVAYVSHTFGSEAAK